MAATTASAGSAASTSSSARASEARVAQRLSVDAVLLGDAHRDVADGLVAVVERARRARSQPTARVVAYDARVRDDRLVPYLGALVA